MRLPSHMRQPQQSTSTHRKISHTHQAHPQSTTPVKLIENHQIGKGVLGQTKKNPRRDFI
jgi:hypothetical protein